MRVTDWHVGQGWRREEGGRGGGRRKEGSGVRLDEAGRGKSRGRKQGGGRMEKKRQRKINQKMCYSVSYFDVIFVA